MPIQALSIFACLPERQALDYLQSQCGFPKQVCSGKLAQARAKYGKPMPRAGYPDIQDIPPEFTPYLEQVKLNPRFGETIDNGNIGYSFQLVEVDPLLAFQFYISLDHIPQVSVKPTLEEMLHLCLPVDVKDVALNASPPSKDAVVLYTTDLNTRLYRQPSMVPDPQQKLLGFVGLFIGIGSPLIQVAKYEGRYYLKNGYHRVYALRKAGVAYIPSILIEAKSTVDIGLTDPGFLPMSILKSNNPPTMGHFTNDRTFPISLKKTRREIKISWSENVVADE